MNLTRINPFAQGQLVLASSNMGKAKEIQALLSELPITLVLQSTLGITSVPETGLSFVENALLKARHAAAHSGLPALADDSGLAVDALQGAPGIYSARHAGEDASDQENNLKLLAALKDVPAEQRSARFHCALVLVRNAEDPTPIICEGSWAGQILEAPRGNHGFGYDPLFLVSGTTYSSAELAPETKNAISHRGQALALLRERLKDDFARTI